MDGLHIKKKSNVNVLPYNQQPIGFKVSLAYSASGNFLEKDVDGTLLINGGTTSVSYQNAYDYTGRPHTVTEAGDYTYDWDLNGNMKRRLKSHNDRYFCWDEENRLTAVRDVSEISQSSLYLYDAGGERVWKLTGEEMLTQVNGQTVSSNIYFEKTLYTSPYLVMTESEYTKHYYIEGERVCSKIGGGFGPASVQPADSVLDFIYSDFEHVQTALSNLCGRHLECVDYEGEWEIHKKLDPAGNIDDSLENLQYFYHPDHLGSAAVISFTSGHADQHLQYFPFGELFVSQRNTSFDSRYKFSAKELDNETNYTYFGARYYDSDLSNWISVDPMSDARPNVSPFAYCQNNPIGRVDPTGALDHEYSVDNLGNVKKEKHVEGSTEDHLHTKENWDNGNHNKSITINDQSILSGLATERSGIDGHYGISNSISDAFNVFYFMANSTNVEWSIDGYRSSGGNEYIVNTSHSGGVPAYVFSTTDISGYSEFNLIFDMHSHTGTETDPGTKGASGFGAYYSGDMSYISARYRRFQSAGMKDTKTWFKKDNQWTVFPKHYVYHKQSKVLYHYTPWKNDVYIRQTSKASDMYYNLGF